MVLHIQMPLTMDNLESVTESLLEVVLQAINEEDQSVENVEAIDGILEEIAENSTITPTKSVRSTYATTPHLFLQRLQYILALVSKTAKK